MKELIFDKALNSALEKGLLKFTLLDVAKASKCSVSTVKHHFYSLNELRTGIVEYGKDNNILWIARSYEKL